MQITKSDKAKFDSYVPTHKLRCFVEALLRPDVMGNKKKAEQITGVKKQTFYWHLSKHPEFKLWFKQQCEAVFTKFLATTVYALQAEARKGNVKAILPILEMAGIYKPAESDGVNVNVNLQPQFDIEFADVIVDNEDREQTKEAEIHAIESTEGAIKRLPL